MYNRNQNNQWNQGNQNNSTFGSWGGQKSWGDFGKKNGENQNSENNSNDPGSSNSQPNKKTYNNRLTASNSSSDNKRKMNDSSNNQSDKENRQGNQNTNSKDDKSHTAKNHNDQRDRERDRDRDRDRDRRSDRRRSGDKSSKDNSNVNQNNRPKWGSTNNWQDYDKKKQSWSKSNPDQGENKRDRDRNNSNDRESNRESNKKNDNQNQNRQQQNNSNNNSNSNHNHRNWQNNNNNNRAQNSWLSQNQDRSQTSGQWNNRNNNNRNQNQSQNQNANGWNTNNNSNQNNEDAREIPLKKSRWSGPHDSNNVLPEGQRPAIGYGGLNWSNDDQKQNYANKGRYNNHNSNNNQQNGNNQWNQGSQGNNMGNNGNNQNNMWNNGGNNNGNNNFQNQWNNSQNQSWNQNQNQGQNDYNNYGYDQQNYNNSNDQYGNYQGQGGNQNQNWNYNQQNQQEQQPGQNNWSQYHNNQNQPPQPGMNGMPQNNEPELRDNHPPGKIVNEILEPTNFELPVIRRLELLKIDKNVPEFVCHEATELSNSGISKYGHLEASSLANVLHDMTRQQYFYALTVGDQNKMWNFYKNYEIIKCEGFRKQLQGIIPMRGRPGWIQQELTSNRHSQMMVNSTLANGKNGSGGNATNTAITFTDWLEDASKEIWFKLLPDKQQKTIWNLAQKRIAMKEYARQKFISLQETVQNSGIPVKLINTEVEFRQNKFARYFAKLSTRLESYKQLMFDYDALCFIPDRNERIMNRLEVVRKNLFQTHDQMKRTALNMAYINKINDLLKPFEIEEDETGGGAITKAGDAKAENLKENKTVLQAIVFKELLAWSAIILKDATWSSFAEDALTTLISDLCDNFQAPAIVLQRTDNSGYFKAAEFTDITEDVQIVEKIKEKNEGQDAYGYPPPSTKKGAFAYYGFTNKMANFFNFDIDPSSANDTNAGNDVVCLSYADSLKKTFKTYAEKYGIIDPLAALVCSQNAKHSYEAKFNSKIVSKVNDVTRSCHQILYGTELWDKDRIKKANKKEKENDQEKIKIDQMIDMIESANLNYQKDLDPLVMDVEMCKSMLEQEILFLEDQLATQKHNLAIPLTETKYRESKVDEEPLAKTTLTLPQVLNYPDRSDRPGKLLIIARGIPGSGRSKIGDRIKQTEQEIGRNKAAMVKILSMRESKFDNSALETERDMVRSLQKEHERLEETVIYDYLRSSATLNNLIYVVEGVFYKKIQYLKIAREAKKNGFTVLFASSRPSNLKDKQREKVRNENWLNKCLETVKENWKPYLNFLVKNFEPVHFEEDIALDVWEIYEESFEAWNKSKNEAKRSGPIVLS